jgi:hypothetical protein
MNIQYNLWERTCYQSLTLKQNASIPIRYETHEGRETAIVPVVLLVEGVHSGSGGPMYYPLDVISADFQTWNGMPVPVFHPNDGGMPVSCNSPEVIEQQNVGRLYNVHMDGGKLKGEAWIDVEKATKISPNLIPAIQAGMEIDVSTGLYSTDEMTPGTWNGETYDGIIKDIRPDHLALLPGMQGACNWSDGCGIRANQNQKGGDTLKLKDEDVKTLGQDLIDGKKTGIKERLAALARFFGFSVNDISDTDLRQKLQSEIDPLDVPPEPTQGLYHYVRDIYSDAGYFVYEARNETETKLFKQKFEMKDDEIKLKGEPEEVKQETNYIAAAALRSNEKTEVKENMERKEQIDGLIANKKTTFTEDDRKWLETLDDCSFARVAKLVDELTPVVNEPNEPAPVPKTPETPKPQTVDEYIANAPGEVADVLKESMRMRSERKENLIRGILGNAANVWTEDELKAKGVGELEKIAAMGNLDFSGRGGSMTQAPKSNERQADGSGVPDMPSLIPAN